MCCVAETPAGFRPACGSRPCRAGQLEQRTRAGVGRFVQDSCRPSFINIRHTLMSINRCFSRVSHGSSASDIRPLEKMSIPMDVEKDRKTCKRIDFRQVPAKIPHRQGLSQTA